MRILIATTHRSVVGGVETYLAAVLPALVARGHDVALLHEEPAYPGHALVDAGMPGLTLWHWRDGEGLHAAERWQPDVCFAQGLGAPEHEAQLLDRFPTVLFAHNYYGTCISGSKCQAFPRPQPCGRAFGSACLALYYPRRCGGLSPRTFLRQYALQRRRRDLLTRYETILVASRHMADEFVRNGVPVEQVQVVPLFPPGMTPDVTPPVPRPLTNRVLMLGRLTDLKGGKYLIVAVAQASRALGRKLTLTIAGDGPERSRLERLAQRLKVRAEFCGWVDAAKREALLRAADVLVVPSVWPEPFGLVGIEAGCVGVPAVAYAVGGIVDWLRPGVSGELAPGDPPTVAGLSAALVRTLGVRDQRDKLAHGAWCMAREFTCSRHIAALEQSLPRCRANRRAEPALF